MTERNTRIHTTRKFAYAMALAGFLFPFVSVSCMDRQVIAPSGLELAVGAEVPIDDEFADELGDDGLDDSTPRANALAAGDNDPDGWLLIAATALTGLVAITFMDKNGRVSKGFSVGLVFSGVVALGFFWVNVRSEARELEALGFDVAPGFGLWITTAAVLVGGAADISRDDPDPSNRTRLTSMPPTSRVSPPHIKEEPRPLGADAGDRASSAPVFCVQCGERFRHQDVFCGYCGTRRSR